MVSVFVKLILNFQYSPEARLHDKNSGLNTPMGYILVLSMFM